MYLIGGWAMGLTLALLIVYIFSLKSPIAAVLLGFSLSLAGIILGEGLNSLIGRR